MAFIGTFTGLVVKEFDAKTAWDAVTMAGILVGFYLPVAGLLIWMWRRPGRFMGHSWQTWIGLVVIAFLAGLLLAVLL